MFPTLLSASIVGFASTLMLLLSASHSRHQPDNQQDDCNDKYNPEERAC